MIPQCIRGLGISGIRLSSPNEWVEKAPCVYFKAEVLR